MRLPELKNKVYDYASNMLDQWFDREPFVSSIAKTVLKANINKYDEYFTYITDEKGNVLIDELVENMKSIIPEDGYHIDIKGMAMQYNMSPFIVKMLPNKILLFTREDLNNLISTLK